MAFSASIHHDAVAEMNLTPLVDVMLVLLVIFMVSVPLVAEPMQASLPQPSPQASPVRAVLHLEIDADGGYRLDGRMLAPVQLEHRLADALVQGDGRASLSVRANADASYQAVVTALAVARASGVRDIAIMP